MGLIRKINKGALKQACREAALENYGYIDAGDRQQLQRINEIYAADDEVTSKRRYKESVERTDVQDTFKTLAAEHKYVEYDSDERKNICFFIPFEFGEFEDDEFLSEVASCFENAPIRTREQLRSSLNKVDIASGEFHRLTDALQDYGYIASGFSNGGTEYYMAGGKLTNSSHVDTVPSLAAELEDTATDGVVTLTDISNVLNIRAGQAIADHLVESGDLYDLGEEYVVAMDGCIEDHVTCLVDQPFAQSIQDNFADANHILSRSEFKSVVRSEIESRSDILKYDVSEHLVVDTVETVLQTEFHLSFKQKSFSTNNTAEQFLVRHEEVDNFVTKQAKMVISSEANGELPLDEKSFVKNVKQAIRNRDFSGTRIGSGARTDHYRDLISSEVERIAKRGDIKTVISE